MSEPIETRRRSFLKGSLVFGAAAVAAPGSRSIAQLATTRGRSAAAPSSATEVAESGAVDVERHREASGTPRTAASEADVITRPGSDYMIHVLRAAGIKYLAAMVGSSFRGLHESIVNYAGNSEPELIVCMHEEISAGIAHGYAKASGTPMACALHSTVGLQHASMAIYNAWCDRVPMLILAGNVADITKRRPGVEWDHTAGDLAAFVRDYIKWDDAPTSLTHFGESTMRAMQLAMTAPYEPVLIVTDGELQEEPASPAGLKVPPLPRVFAPAGSADAIAQAADMLIAAEQPLIVVDRAVRSQAGVDQLVKLAEALNTPVVDLTGRMNMPTNHYLNHSGRRSQLVRAADCILGIELTDMWGLVNAVPDKIDRKAVRLARADAKIIGISALYGFIHGNVQDAQRWYPCDLTIDADGETCLTQLVEAIARRMPPARLRAIAARRPMLEATFRATREESATAAAVGWDASPVSTARLSMELWDRIKHLDWSLVSEAKFLSSWPQRLWDFTKFYQYLGGSGGYGVGYGLPAAIGAALANRDAGRTTIAVLGDGDVMMTPGGFWTMAHHAVPMLVVMHNNRAWHQETMHLRRMASRRDRGGESWSVGTTIMEPLIDFSAMARSMGVWGEGPIDDPAMLGPAIDRALAVVRGGKPALLDVITQPR